MPFFGSIHVNCDGDKVVYMQDEAMDDLHTGQAALASSVIMYMHTFITLFTLGF